VSLHPHTLSRLGLRHKTLFEMVEFQPFLNYVCEFYPNIVDQILCQLEGIIPRKVPDRGLFSILSHLFLNPIVKRELNQENLPKWLLLFK
jgi:hypothetical protein